MRPHQAAGAERAHDALAGVAGDRDALRSKADGLLEARRVLDRRVLLEEREARRHR
mgnify:CR=1 FL=1